MTVSWLRDIAKKRKTRLGGGSSAQISTIGKS
jgi:hypothetical protein